MNTVELVHNQVFVRDGEAWFRDFEKEISVRDLMREICTKHASSIYTSEMDNETLDTNEDVKADFEALKSGEKKLEDLAEHFWNGKKDMWYLGMDVDYT